MFEMCALLGQLGMSPAQREWQRQQREAARIKYPRIEPLLGAPVTTIIGDARVIVPLLEADVACVDIAPRYGNNTFPPCPKIGRVWVWGSARIGGRDAY